MCDTSVRSISCKIYKLNLIRDMAKDYYRVYPSMYKLYEIQQLAHEIRSLKRQLTR
jgi:hypothetical protein